MDMSDSEPALPNYAVKIKNAIALVLIFRRRCKRLSSRLLYILDNIPKLADDGNQDIITEPMLSLLKVTVDDLVEYFKMMSLKSRALSAHLLKYGSDEENFSKWNERLRLISQEMKIALPEELLDANGEQKDLDEDIKSLGDLLPSLSNDAVEKAAILKLLDAQKKNAFKTLLLEDNGIIIQAKSIKYENLLGSGIYNNLTIGAFGEVWRARIRSDFVAVKKIPHSLLNEKSRASLKLEAKMMRSLSHPGIVACIGIVDDGVDVCLVMELCSMGSLDNLIVNNKELALKVRLDIALDVAIAMSYLHRLNVVHRDLKPGNIVLDSNMRPKVTDFGLALTQSSSMTSIRGSEMGTPAFMAPECFGLTPIFSTKSDVYAFSIILWELLHMTKAYHQVNVLEIRDSIKNGERLPIDSKISQALKNLITSTWEQNPRARPSFPGILKYLQAYISPEGDCKALPDTILMNTIALPRIAQLESSLELSSHLAVIKKAGGTPNVKGSTLQRGSKFSHRKKLIILAFILIILASGGVGVYFYTTSNKAGSESQSSSPGSTIPTSTPTSGAPITLPFPAVCAKDVKPTSLPTNCAIQNPVVSDYAGTGYAGGQDGSRLTAATFNYPTGIAFHPDGSLIIGQIGGFRNISGNSVRTISLFTNVTIDGIQQFAIDNTGIMFAPVGASERGSTTYTGYFIITVDTNRNVTLLAGIPSIGGSINSDDLTQSTFFRARQTLIHNGEIYVVSDGKQGGVRFPTTGSIRVINTCVGDPNYGVRTMYDFPNDPTVNPLSIAFDSNGDGCNVTLTIDVSTSAQCIAKFSNGIVNHCFAGTKNVAGTNDGPPNLGKFNFPGGLAFDKCGNLFVADRGNKYTVL